MIMQAIEVMTSRLAGCATLAATLETAWDAFGLMMRIADGYSGDEADIAAGFGFASVFATASDGARRESPSVLVGVPHLVDS
jgi:hypothetical protein